MDAFFASVEQRDAPNLRGLPVAVGGSGERAVVAAASYEARAFGVRSAMPMRRALQLCPNLVVVPGRFPAYREASRQIRDIFGRYTELVEPLALDEAYLDVSAPKRGPPSGTLIARAIKADVKREVGLTASAGVARSKFLAKLASGLRKPDGLSVILPDEEDAFVRALPVGSFFGVGPATEAKMHAMGLLTGADLRAVGAEALVEAFGKSGKHFYEMAWCRDERPVDPNRPRKSVGAETTFEVDVTDEVLLDETLVALAEEVFTRLERTGSVARTATVKMRLADFRTITRSHTGAVPIGDLARLLRTIRRLAFEVERPEGALRLLGVTVSQLLEPGGVYQPLIEFDVHSSGPEE